jgi:malonate transporter and related proteins
MLDILGITGPIYIAIGLGFATVRRGWFSAADIRAFGKFVLHLALPAMLFNALARRPIAEILIPGYLLAYLAGSLAVVAGGLFWRRRLCAEPVTLAVVKVMGMACSNSGYVGFPILLLTLAPVAGVALALNMVVENLIVIPLLLALAERGRGAGAAWWQVVAQSLTRLARNPLIIGLAAGLLVSLSGWQLPQGLQRTVDLFAAASAALSLFVIGGSLVGLPLRGMLRAVAPVVAVKLLGFPALVFVAVQALPLLGIPPLSPALQQAAVLMAAMPMMGIYPVLALQYGLQGLAASAMLVATAVSFVTINLLLWVFARMA